jgi:NTE family protein
MTTTNELGISLSGGGYRASAFHLGTLNKLHKLGILEKVDVISTISGGSITGAAWGLYEGSYETFHQEMINKISSKDVLNYIFSSFIFFRTVFFVLIFVGGAVWLSFTRWSPFTLPVVAIFVFLFLKWQFKIFPVSKIIEKAYKEFFFDDKTLKDLKTHPILAIGSSNLETGRPFTFSKDKMSDSYYSSKSNYDPPIVFVQSEFPVARAVMASSCVPGAFTPVLIDKSFFKSASDFDRIHPQLVDGGVYDNQGIQKITQPKSRYECRIIITSDAGNQFFANEKYPNSIALLSRTVGLFMNRIKNSQLVQDVYQNTSGASRPIAYLSLGWRIQNLIPGFINNMIESQVTNEVINAHQLQPEWVKNPSAFRNEIQSALENSTGYAAISDRDLTFEEWNMVRKTGTNLTKLSLKRIELLIRHAENLTELQVKLYCPMLIH